MKRFGWRAIFRARPVDAANPSLIGIVEASRTTYLFPTAFFREVTMVNKETELRVVELAAAFVPPSALLPPHRSLGVIRE